MITPTLTSRPSPPIDAGLWIVGGAAWLVAGLVAGGSVEPLWIVSDLLLLAALVRLWRAGPANPWRPSTAATVGLALAIAARVAFVAAEIVAATTGEDENALLPLGAVGTAVGLTVFGVAVVRHHHRAGVRRFAPLAAGLYPFVGMFPILAATGEPPTVGIALWGLPLALVGWSMATEPAVEG